MRLEKRVLALREINNNCYSHIRESIHKNLRLFEEVENVSNARGNVNNFDHDREEDSGYDDCDYDQTSINGSMIEGKSASDEKEEPT